jgi:hypothetical protein
MPHSRWTLCHNGINAKGYHRVPNWRFWEKHSTEETTGEVHGHARTATVGEPVPKPPPPEPPAPLSEAERTQRISALKRRREGALYDLNQSQLAHDEQNPWRERILLLTEVIETVDRDVEVLTKIPKRESYPLPQIPIVIQEVHTEEPPAIAFEIAGQSFRYEEELDWAERGTTVVRGELQHRSGDPSALPMDGVPEELRPELIDHLSESLFAFATDVRDRAIAGESMPEAPTLADLARPCPDCGGWQDWMGVCPECKRRQWQRQQLDAEADRLDRERTAEIEDQAKWAERLPIARRRMTDIDGELASLGAPQP